MTKICSLIKLTLCLSRFVFSSEKESRALIDDHNILAAFHLNLLWFAWLARVTADNLSMQSVYENKSMKNVVGSRVVAFQLQSSTTCL